MWAMEIAAAFGDWTQMTPGRQPFQCREKRSCGCLLAEKLQYGRTEIE
jgi:hypothetical protein